MCQGFIHFARHNTARLCAFFAQNSRQFARIDVGNRDNIIATQIVGKRLIAAEIAFQQGQVANNQAASIDFARFHIFRVAASIADVWIGERDDLLGVGWIGKDFLIAGHRRVEHDFADRVARSANGNAIKNSSIC